MLSITFSGETFIYPSWHEGIDQSTPLINVQKTHDASLRYVQVLAASIISLIPQNWLRALVCL